MKWTEYPTKADQENKRNGTQRTGQKWADGPAPGSRWVIPDDDSSRFALVRPRETGGPYSVLSDDFARGSARTGCRPDP